MNKIKSLMFTALLTISINANADFDNTNPANLASLQFEVVTDPTGMGYASVSGQTNRTLDLLNNPDNNVGLDAVSKVLTPRLILTVVVPEDLTVGNKFSQGQLEWYKSLLTMSLSLDDNLDDFKVKFRNLFDITPAPQTLINLDAQNRTISRAEVLFGVDTVISRDDWLAARDYAGQ